MKNLYLDFSAVFNVLLAHLELEDAIRNLDYKRGIYFRRPAFLPFFTLLPKAWSMYRTKNQYGKTLQYVNSHANCYYFNGNLTEFSIRRFDNDMPFSLAFILSSLALPAKIFSESFVKIGD